MDPSVVFEKTPKGEEALRHRDESLPSDLRMVLLIINGSRNVETIQLISDPCKTSIAPLIFLEDNGYIQRIGTRANIFPLRGNAAVATAPVMTPANDAGQAYAQATYTPQAPQMQVQAQPQAQMQPQQMPPQQVQPQQAYAPQNFVPQQDDAALRNRLSELKSFLIQTLGQDANAIIGRVSEVRTTQEYSEIVGKLYNLIRDYSSVRDAERFMQRFELPHP
jgi:hypothetical protein